MKNKDYNLGVEYELKIINSLELKEKLMKDNNLTEEDIFLHYSLNKLEKEEIHYIDVFGENYYRDKFEFGLDISSILSNYLALKKGFTIDKELEMLEGRMDINQICKEYNIKDKPFKDSNSETYKDFLTNCNLEYVKDSLYKKVSYKEAVFDTINYNIDTFNKSRNISDEKFREGLENSYVVINERTDGRYELLDGFYRILYKNIDCNVVVKIYKNVTDEEWFKLMINLNYWKTNVNNQLFYDRGFLLGLRCRFNIKIEDYIYPLNNTNFTNLVYILSNTIQPILIQDSSLFKKGLENKNILDYYSKMNCIRNTNEFRRNTLLSKYFINDLNTLTRYLAYLPENILNLKKVKEVNVFSSYAYRIFLNNLIKAIFNYRVMHSDIEMNELPNDLIDILFKDKEIKDSFVKSINLIDFTSIDKRMESLYPNLFLIFKDYLLK